VKWDAMALSFQQALGAAVGRSSRATPNLNAQYTVRLGPGAECNAFHVSLQPRSVSGFDRPALAYYALIRSLAESSFIGLGRRPASVIGNVGEWP
jgi:hypothetical protein